MKRKIMSPNTSPSQPDPKRQNDGASTSNPTSTEGTPPVVDDPFTTPVRPTQFAEAPPPRPNRNLEKSLRSTTSMASFKSIEEITSKTKKVEISEYDFNATRVGKMRNLIEVDVHMIDGTPYTAQISEIEAYKLIYRQGLDMDSAIFYGIRLLWAGHPLIEFRLRESVDIDTLPKTFRYRKPDFDIDGKEISRIVTCEIRGVRDPNQEKSKSDKRDEPEVWPITRWVKIEGTTYDMPRSYLERCLDYFGTRETPLEVEAIEFIDSDSETEDKKVTIHTGNLSVKMKLKTGIPQFIPLYGKRVKIHYRGIIKSCTKCYQQGHSNKECKNERALLVDYASEFMETFTDFPMDLYGRWSTLVDVNRRAKNLPELPRTSTSRGRGRGRPSK